MIDISMFELSKKSEFRIIFLIFLVGIIVRIVFSFITGSLTDPLTFEYEETARNILAGYGFSNKVFGIEYYAYLEPFYPLFVAFFYKFTPFDKTGLLIFQMIIGALLSIIIYLITKNIFSKRIGIAACILTALHPGMIIYSATNLHPLTFDAFFFSLLVIAFLAIHNRPCIWTYIGTGILLGITILSRSTILLFIPLGYMWLYLSPSYSHNKKTKLTAIFIITITAFAVVLPWQIRNQIRFKKFVFICSSKGQHFWRGNNINASGTLWYGDKPYTEYIAEKLEKNLSGKNELEQDRIFREEAFKFIRTYPLTFLRLWIQKFYYFWWFSPSSGKQYPSLWFSIYRIYYAIILVAFITGIAIFVGNYKKNILFKGIISILLIISVSIGQSLFYVEGRHRWEIEPLIFIFSAYGFYEILRWKKTKIYSDIFCFSSPKKDNSTPI